ncbi:hypothetical protein BASA81_001566 [Batrachochytrium salamandrivorans]|nr:hypothetical protein BASA81_001566 [Batrachochytrium salamandrivorans]
MSERIAELFGHKAKPSLILAPMVRAGSLPLRLLSLHYGATTVFSEEIIAKKLLGATRVENAELKTVDFIMEHKQNNLVFRTCEMEQGKNILQLGSANATEALHAAQLVQRDVAGVDLNMGCPEHFSIHGNMGAALLAPKPEVAMDILQALRRNLPPTVTVSCKVRLLEDQKHTIEMLQNLERAGAEAITIHARRRPERPRDRARWEELEEIIQHLSVPVVVNGSVFQYANDYDRILQAAPSASGVMVARGALDDFSAAFCNDKLSAAQICEQYLGVAELCGTNFGNSKWYLSQLLRYRTDLGEKQVLSQALAKSRTFPDLRAAFGVDSELALQSTLWQDTTSWTTALQRAMYPSSPVKRLCM